MGVTHALPARITAVGTAAQVAAMRTARRDDGTSTLVTTAARMSDQATTANQGVPPNHWPASTDSAVA